MKIESQLQLQAYLDGELPEAERRDVESWLTHDPEARALLAELRQTDAALLRADSDIRVPESREFYWSKIEREIQRRASQDRDTAPSRTPAWLALWRRWLMPAGALAVLTLAFVIGPLLVAGRPHEIEVVLATGNGTTYRDHARGMTLVWFSFPAENRFPEDELDALLFY